MYLILIWSTIIVGAGLTILLGMALHYDHNKTKGR